MYIYFLVYVFCKVIKVFIVGYKNIIVFKVGFFIFFGRMVYYMVFKFVEYYKFLIVKCWRNKWLFGIF